MRSKAQPNKEEIEKWRNKKFVNAALTEKCTDIIHRIKSIGGNDYYQQFNEWLEKYKETEDQVENFFAVSAYNALQDPNFNRERFTYEMNLTYDCLFSGSYPLLGQFGLIFSHKLNKTESKVLCDALRAVYCEISKKRQWILKKVYDIVALEICKRISGVIFPNATNGLVADLLERIGLHRGKDAKFLAKALSKLLDEKGFLSTPELEINYDVCTNPINIHRELLRKTAHNAKGAGRKEAPKEDFLKAFLMDLFMERATSEIQPEHAQIYIQGDIFTTHWEKNKQPRDEFAYSQKDLVKKIAQPGGLKELVEEYNAIPGVKRFEVPDYEIKDPKLIREVLEELEYGGLIVVARGKDGRDPTIRPSPAKPQAPRNT